MKRLVVGACVLLIAFLVVSPVMAQRAVPTGGDGGRGVSSDASSGATVTSTSSATPSYSGGSYTSSGEIGSRGFVSYTPSTVVPPSYTYKPNLDNSSFYTIRSYNYWNDYYGYLLRNFSFDALYFGRFMRNTEPLITPAVLKVTMSEPLILSRQMLRDIDDLDMMLADARAGKAVDREAILEKTQRIRDCAKAIRVNPTIVAIDIRQNTDILKGEDIDAASPEAIARLREMALDLNRQLTEWHDRSSASTVSVESYREASFESVAKGIEKVCKAIEHSSKRL